MQKVRLLYCLRKNKGTNKLKITQWPKANGTVALYAALKSLNIGPGDEVDHTQL